HLQLRRRHGRLVEGADGELQAAVVLVGVVNERRAAIAAEATPRLVGTFEIFWAAAGPGHVIAGDQRPEEPAEGLLAHAAVADAGTAEATGAEADGAALATAGQPGIILLHDRPPRCCSRRGHGRRRHSNSGGTARGSREPRCPVHPPPALQRESRRL